MFRLPCCRPWLPKFTYPKRSQLRLTAGRRLVIKVRKGFMTFSYVSSYVICAGFSCVYAFREAGRARFTFQLDSHALRRAKRLTAARLTTSGYQQSCALRACPADRIVSILPSPNTQTVLRSRRRCIPGLPWSAAWSSVRTELPVRGIQDVRSFSAMMRRCSW